MAQEALVEVVVIPRGMNKKSLGMIHDGKHYKIGDKFSAKKADALYYISTGKCAEVGKAEKAEAKK